jgi:hypothetical protein
MVDKTIQSKDDYEFRKKFRKYAPRSIANYEQLRHNMTYGRISERLYTIMKMLGNNEPTNIHTVGAKIHASSKMGSPYLSMLARAGYVTRSTQLTKSGAAHYVFTKLGTAWWDKFKDNALVGLGKGNLTRTMLEKEEELVDADKRIAALEAELKLLKTLKKKRKKR